MPSDPIIKMDFWIDQKSNGFLMTFDNKKASENATRYQVTGPSTNVMKILTEYAQANADKDTGLFTKAQCDDFVSTNSNSYKFEKAE